MDQCVNPELSRLADAYDTLDAKERSALKAHLEDCAACRRKVGFHKLIEMATGEKQQSSPADHPSPDKLLAFMEAGDKPLSPEERFFMEEHIERCPACSELAGILKGLVEEGEAAGLPQDDEEETASAKERAARLGPLFADAKGLPKEGPTSHPWKRLLLATLSVAATVVLLLTGIHLTDDSPPASWFADVRIENMNRTRSSANGLRFGDPFLVRCLVSRSAWIYAFEADPDAGILPVAPETFGEPPIKAAGHEWFYIPGEDDPLHATEPPVKENILILAAFEEPLGEDAFKAVRGLLSKEWDPVLRDEEQLSRALRSFPGIGRASVKIVIVTYGE